MMDKVRFIKFALYLYAVVIAVLLFGNRGWFPDFYNPRFMAAVSFISAFLIVLPSALFRTEDAARRGHVHAVQSAVAASLLMNGAGALGLYRLYVVGFQYDKLAHFVTSLVLTLAFSRFWRHWFGLNLGISLFRTSAAVFGLGICWELLEAFSDWAFGTQMWGTYSQHIFSDTVWDLVMNALGVFAAGVFLLFKYRSNPFVPRLSK